MQEPITAGRVQPHGPLQTVYQAIWVSRLLKTAFAV